MTTWSKKLISLLCAITLAYSLTPALAWSSEADKEETGSSDVANTTTSQDPPESSATVIEIETSATPEAIGPQTIDPEGLVALKPGNHERWIDRIDVPDFALEFYEVLEEAIDNDGYRDFLIDDKYYNGTAPNEGAYTMSEHRSPNEPILVFYQWNSHEGEEYSHSEQNSYLSAVMSAFVRDHPEAFWLASSYRSTGDYLDNGDGTSTNCTGIALSRMRARNYPTESRIKADIAKRDATVDSILLACEGKDVAGKLTYFNDWLTLNNEYNTFPNLKELNNYGTYPQAWTCISALDGREGEQGPVCEGYAKAFKVLCDKSGIPCVLVDGIGYSGWSAEGHMWNNVKVDGSWYAVDVTWNDPSNGGSGKVTGSESHDWLLLGSESRDSRDAAFGETHRTANLPIYKGTAFLNGPVLSASAYPGYGENAAPGTDDNDEGGDEPTMPDDPITSEPEKALISIAKSTISVSAKTYTGKTLSPTAVTVKLGSKTLKKGTDYTVTCKGGKKVGAYTVTIKGKGAYAGTKTTTFKILPKGTSVSKLTKASKGFTATWKKPSAAARSQIDGYQVRYATASNMKGAKTVTVKGAAKTSAKVAKLKGNKTYYVQVRSYKKVSGKTYYSTWSTTKSVKTKK